jgi:hypothetical protein
MSACCDAVSDRKTPTWVRSVREIFAWALPSALLVLVPKCPACLAAYVTLWTGLGLSLSTATYVRRDEYMPLPQNAGSCCHAAKAHA